MRENERGKIKQLVFNRTEQDDDGNWVVVDDEVREFEGNTNTHTYTHTP